MISLKILSHLPFQNSLEGIETCGVLPRLYFFFPYHFRIPWKGLKPENREERLAKVAVAYHFRIPWKGLKHLRIDHNFDSADFLPFQNSLEGIETWSSWSSWSSWSWSYHFRIPWKGLKLIESVFDFSGMPLDLPFQNSLEGIETKVPHLK